MSKGFSLVLILIGVFVLTILLTPIPSYENRSVICGNESCYDRRWQFTPSIGERLLTYLKSKPTPPSTPPSDNGSTENDSTEDKFCGGIAANLPENQCPSGYQCQLEGKYPDAGGVCVKTK